MRVSDAPEGWYDDGSGRQRWWDGAQWTDRYADEETATSKRATIVLRLGRLGATLAQRADGTVLYRPSPVSLRPALSVRPSDVTGFSMRRATDADRERLGQSKGLDSIGYTLLEVHGLGTTLGEVIVHSDRYARQIREWFESQPDYGGRAPAAETPTASAGTGSAADEIAKLAELHERGVLTDAEFAAAKARLLGG